MYSISTLLIVLGLSVDASSLMIYCQSLHLEQQEAEYNCFSERNSEGIPEEVHFHKGTVLSSEKMEFIKDPK